MNSKKDLEIEGEIRLQVFLAHAGVCSRRGADELLQQGRVRVNGKVVKEVGFRVKLDDEVTLDHVRVKSEERLVYYALHKPAKYLCSHADQGNRPLAIDLIQPFVKERLFHVGRLDYMTSGLLFFTNDGEWAKNLTHPSGKVEKEYIVQTKKDIPVELLESFKAGLRIEGEKFQCKEYKLNGPHSVHLILCEGKNREIRKVFQSQNITVKRVHRLRIGPVILRGVEPGRFRKLTDFEVRKLTVKPTGGEE